MAIDRCGDSSHHGAAAFQDGEVMTLQVQFIPEIEKEVLGTLLLGGDCRKVASFLEPFHFVQDAHRLIYETIRTASEQYGTNKLPMVAKLIPDDADAFFKLHLDTSAQAYMASLTTEAIYGIPRLVKSAQAVAAQWVRLKLADEAGRLQTAMSDASIDTEKVIRDFSRGVDEISSHLRIGPRKKTLVTLGEAVDLALTEAEAAMQRGTGITGTTWGLADINRLTGGMHPGQLIIIGARPSMGKTVIGVAVGVNAAKSGVGVGVLSLEMSADQLGFRAATDWAYDRHVKVPYTDLIGGRATADQIAAVQAANREISRLPLFIEQQSGLSLGDARVKLETMLEWSEQRGVPFKVLVIDYLQLIRPNNRYQGNKTAEVSEISWGLRNIAREYGITVVALSQLSRQLESRDDKRPQLSDLRESGSLEQDADLVAFLFREAYYLEKQKGKDYDAESMRLERLIDCQNKLEFIIAKQRNGAVKTVDLFIDVACSAVRNASRVQQW